MLHTIEQIIRRQLVINMDDVFFITPFIFATVPLFVMDELREIIGLPQPDMSQPVVAEEIPKEAEVKKPAPVKVPEPPVVSKAEEVKQKLVERKEPELVS